MLEEIFIKTGGRDENPEIAKVCSEVTHKALQEQLSAWKKEVAKYVTEIERDSKGENFLRAWYGQTRKEMLEKCIEDLELTLAKILF